MLFFNPKSDAYTIQSCLLTGDLLARVLGYCRLQRWQHPSWTGERLGFELVSTPNVSRQAKRGSRYLCRLKFKAVPATIVQIALVSFDSCQHAGTAEFVHVNNFKAVQRQQQLDRTQQTFHAAASVAQSWPRLKRSLFAFAVASIDHAVAVVVSRIRKTTFATKRMAGGRWYTRYRSSSVEPSRGFACYIHTKVVVFMV